MSAFSSLAEMLQELVGKELTSAKCVEDYIQLCFADLRLSVYNYSEVIHENSRRVVPGDPTFEHELLRCIGHTIASVDFVNGDQLILVFNNLITLKVSLQDQDYRGPEALQFEDGSGKFWVA